MLNRCKRETWSRELSGCGKEEKLNASHTRSVGPRADPGLQVTISHPHGGRLPLLSTKPAVTFPAAECHCFLAGTKLYCLVTEAHRCEQLAQSCYSSRPQVGFEPMTCWSQVQRSTRCATAASLDVVELGKCAAVKQWWWWWWWCWWWWWDATWSVSVCVCDRCWTAA